ncbi:MAG: sulfite exporter TauE/SafE family protein [Leptolyngbya sp. SIO4C1]|nr:sulfite exporter TauE/SafE family protein [Leptolyngbya sp. SIO4C1]
MVLLILGTVSCVVWFFSMLAGGGGPLILIPLVSALLGTQAVAPVVTTGMLVGNAQRSLFFRSQIDWSLTGWYLPGAIAGAVLGAYCYRWVHLEWLQLIIGACLLLMVLNYFCGSRLSHWQCRAWHFLPVAFINAVGSGLVGSTGPIMNPMYLSYGLLKEEMIATKSLHKAVLHLVKLAAYLAFGVLSSEHLRYGLVIGLAGIPANWLGKQVLAQMSAQQFRQVVFGLIAVSGLWMLWQQRQLLIGL